MYRAWILKIPKNRFFLTLTIFQTDVETWVYQEDVFWATAYDNICFHAEQ